MRLIDDKIIIQGTYIEKREDKKQGNAFLPRLQATFFL